MKWGNAQQDKKQGTVRFTLYLRPDMLDAIEQDAKKNYRSVNKHILSILDEYLEQEKTA